MSVALVRIAIVVAVAVDVVRETVLFAVQLLILPAGKVSAVARKIVDALVVQSCFLTLQMTVFACRQLAVAHTLVNAMFLPRFAIAHFTRLCGDRSDEACGAKYGECEEFTGRYHDARVLSAFGVGQKCFHLHYCTNERASKSVFSSSHSTLMAVS